VGDFNGDGVPDLAVANDGVLKLSVLLGNGDGSFQAARDTNVGAFQQSVVVADFNGDGILDLAVTNYTAPGKVSVLLGNGDGTFQDLRSFDAGSYPSSLAVADFNGDGIPDLAVATSLGTRVLLGNGDGSFKTTNVSYLTGNSSAVAVGDFNGDSLPDLAVTDSATSSVFILDNDGNWTGAARGRGSAPRPTATAQESELAVQLVPQAGSNDSRPSVDLPLNPALKPPTGEPLARTSAESEVLSAPRLLIGPRPLRHALMIRASWDLQDDDLGPFEAW
jgi:hypothetical protein